MACGPVAYAVQCQSSESVLESLKLPFESFARACEILGMPPRVTIGWLLFSSPSVSIRNYCGWFLSPTF